MDKQLEDRAWDLVQALATTAMSPMPASAVQVLGDLRQRAVALLAERSEHGSLAQSTRPPFFGLPPVLAHLEPVEEMD